MLAWKIDPYEKSISVIEIDGSLQSYYKAMSTETIGVNMMELVKVDRENDIYVDEEGLFKPDQRFFTITGGVQPYAGIGIAVGSTPDGDNCGSKLSPLEIMALVGFPNA